MAKTSATKNSLIPPRALFRFSVEVRRCEPLWSAHGVVLDESYRLPVLSELDGEKPLADVRMAWSPEGLAWWVCVEGKQQVPWCRESRLEDSDSLQVWVDTRATFNVHRASRFCHRFAFLPCGGGPDARQPVTDQLLIHRARENARPVRPRELQVFSQVSQSGYKLAAFAPAGVLGGFDPEQQPRLGFTYAVLDREQGLQTFQPARVGPTKKILAVGLRLRWYEKESPRVAPQAFSGVEIGFRG